MRRHSAHARDAALAQLSRVNRWLIAGSVLLTGAFAEIAANAFPGKSRHPSSNAAHRASGSHGTSTSQLKPPAQPPQSAAEAAREQTPAESSAATPEADAPSSEAASPAPESQAAPEAAAPSESQPAPESAPPAEAAPEASGPVVSGGS